MTGSTVSLDARLGDDDSPIVRLRVLEEEERERGEGLRGSKTRPRCRSKQTRKGVGKERGTEKQVSRIGGMFVLGKRKHGNGEGQELGRKSDRDPPARFVSLSAPGLLLKKETLALGYA